MFALDKVFFLINLGNSHWGLVVANVQQHRLQYYDSMRKNGHKFLQALEKYFINKHIQKKKTPDPQE
jgi:Ulp1 family protease